MTHPALATRPETVALVALGPSHRDFINARIPKKDSTHFDEVWVVNSGSEVFRCDKLWLMDDLKVMEQRYPVWAERLKKSSTAIITCKGYEDYPAAVEYPLEDVLKCIEDDWLTTTVAYAIAYSILIGVKELYLFGADFMYPGSKIAEPGADCCAYLLGMRKARGLSYKIPLSSTLLDSHLCTPQPGGAMRRPLYGYDYNPGDCRDKVANGTATELEKLLALKAPHKTEGIQHVQHANAPVPRGQERASAHRERKPLHPVQRAEPGAGVPAGGPGVLRGRVDDIVAAGLGGRAAAALQPAPAGVGRVDGGGQDPGVEISYAGPDGRERDARLEH